MHILILSLIFRRRNGRWIKEKLSFAFLNLRPSNASYSQGEAVKFLFISLSRTDFIVVHTEPCQVVTL
jgi:hypothetical protein